MINPVEKSFEVEVNHVAVTLGNVALRLSYRLVGGASRAEPVAVFGERRVPLLLENLQQGLLISLSTTQGTPSFLTPPSGLGISTRLTGRGW